MRRERAVNVLSLDTDWALGEEAFAECLSRIKPLEPKVILEFGSGISTVRLSMELRNCQIHSVESSTEFCSETLMLAKDFEVSARVRVMYRPPYWRRFGLGLHLTYASGALPSKVDCLLIDGPPGWMCRGREACMYDAFQSLKIGGLAVLDDYSRPSEKDAVRAWLAVYPGCFEFEEVDMGHGLCFLRKVKSCPPHWGDFSLMPANVRSWYRLVRYLGAKVRNRLLGR